MDPITHKRFLEYRERYVYFGSGKQQLDASAFATADVEQRALDAKGDARTDEEEARFVELSEILFRD